MSSPLSFWERFRRARIVQVLAVYLGASWMVIQITDTLSDALRLPAWVIPVELMLLLIGMVVILATAWVQSHPATTPRAEAGGFRPTGRSPRRTRSRASARDACRTSRGAARCWAA